jgi:hypothetical protein
LPAPYWESPHFLLSPPKNTRLAYAQTNGIFLTESKTKNPAAKGLKQMNIGVVLRIELFSALAENVSLCETN